MSKELIDRLRDDRVTGFNLTIAAVEAADLIEQLMCDTQEVNAARIYLREKEGLLRELAEVTKQRDVTGDRIVTKPALRNIVCNSSL